MTRSVAVLALAFALTWPVNAGARPVGRSVCVPVYIEGAGIVRMCARPPRRR